MLQKPSGCVGCPLYEKGFGFSNPEGLGSLGVLVMGEALGKHEALAGLPFRPEAPAGSLLERVIKMCRFDRQQFRLYNIVNCEPPKDWLEGAPWEIGAINHCEVHRRRVYWETQPKVILALGNVALRNITGHAGKKRGITYMRGYVHPALDWEIPVVAGLHPSYLRRGKVNLINVLAADIKRAVNIATGKDRNFCLYPDKEAHKWVEYITRPTEDQARSYELYLRDNPNLLVNFDIETLTSNLLAEDEDVEIEQAALHEDITQIQFSHKIGWAICMPWFGKFKEIALRILAMAHQKAGHNAWRFDLPVLRRSGATINGIVHDTRWMWHHLQPDLPAELQFVTSFYGMPFPWKHMAQYNDEFYGCADADALSRIMHKLPEQLASKGIWEGYERQILGLDPYLVNMSGRGIPINEEKRMELGDAIRTDREKARDEIQPLIPPELIKWKVYKRPPKDKTGLVLRDDPELVEAFKDQETLFVEGDHPMQRWSKCLGFNPGSWQQLIEYLKFRGIPVPKKYKSDEDTTEETELLKLIHRLKGKSKKKFGNDVRVLELVLDYREADKMLGTYVEGWKPKADGRVHPQFGHGTAVGQLNSKDPNGQNFPIRSDLAKKMRAMISAEEGYVIIEIDKSSYHAITLAFEAQSKNWMRLARSDIHSFTTAHFLKLPERDQLLDWPDDQLVDYLAWVKEHHEETRNNKAKHAILGVGNGLGYRKLYRQYWDYFEGENEAKTLLDTIKGIFPEVFAYQNRRRLEAHNPPHYLKGRYPYMRWFFDVLHYEKSKRTGQWELVPGEQSEAAVSYNHVNDAFGWMRDDMLWMCENGYDERFGWINTIHDSFKFHCKKELAEECMHTIYDRFTMKNPLLIDPVTAPDGLWVGCECKVGPNWQETKKVKMPVPVALRSPELTLA